MKTLFKTALILITNRQYNAIDIVIFCLFSISIVQGRYAIGVYSLIVGSILNALLSLKASKL